MQGFYPMLRFITDPYAHIWSLVGIFDPSNYRTHVPEIALNDLPPDVLETSTEFIQKNIDELKTQLELQDKIPNVVGFSAEVALTIKGYYGKKCAKLLDKRFYSNIGVEDATSRLDLTYPAFLKKHFGLKEPEIKRDYLTLPDVYISAFYRDLLYNDVEYLIMVYYTAKQN